MSFIRIVNRPTKTILAALAAALLLAACSSDTDDQQQAADIGADVHQSDADVDEPDADVDEPDASADAAAEDTGGQDASSEPDADAALDSGPIDSGPSDTGPNEDASSPGDATSSEDAGPDSSGSLCDSVTPLEDDPDWSQATDIQWPFGDDEAQTFANIFGTWPGSSSSGNLGVLKGEYVALSFQTGALDASSAGQLNREQLAGTNDSLDIGLGPLIASFSRCPGDFDPNSAAVPSPACVSAHPAAFNQIRWGGPGSGRDCELASNTQYYLNVVYTNSDVGQLPPDQATCRQDRPRCGHLWQAVGAE